MAFNHQRDVPQLFCGHACARSQRSAESARRCGALLPFGARAPSTVAAWRASCSASRLLPIPGRAASTYSRPFCSPPSRSSRSGIPVVRPGRARSAREARSSRSISSETASSSSRWRVALSPAPSAKTSRSARSPRPRGPARVRTDRSGRRLRADALPRRLLRPRLRAPRRDRHHHPQEPPRPTRARHRPTRPQAATPPGQPTRHRASVRRAGGLVGAAGNDENDRRPRQRRAGGAHNHPTRTTTRTSSTTSSPHAHQRLPARDPGCDRHPRWPHRHPDASRAGWESDRLSLRGLQRTRRSPPRRHHHRTWRAAVHAQRMSSRERSRSRNPSVSGVGG